MPCKMNSCLSLISQEVCQLLTQLFLTLGAISLTVTILQNDIAKYGKIGTLYVSMVYA